VVLIMTLECRRLGFQWETAGNAAQVILCDVTATFPKGAVSLVTGNTGEGKSTLLHLMAGLLLPTSGGVFADHEPVSRWPTPHRDLWRRKVGVVFQHLALLPELTVGENLLLPLIPRRTSWKDLQASVRNVLEAMGLEAFQRVRVKQLSGGQRQRVAVARAVASTPAYLLADEPTAFQDSAGADGVLQALRRAADNGATVVVCSHDARLRDPAWADRVFSLKDSALSETPPQGNIR
jgi:putative ABC transport system ATP-binding protein